VRVLATVVALILAGASVSAANIREPYQIIQEEDQFIFTDNASFYLLKKDGSFQSGPLGLSGRTITGRWEFQLPSRFVVEGRWGWVNGLSPRDDYRRMALIISAAQGFEEKRDVSAVEPLGLVRIYKCYFAVDELIKLPPPPNSVK
jgi:hypothetical protein